MALNFMFHSIADSGFVECSVGISNLHVLKYAGGVWSYAAAKEIDRYSTSLVHLKLDTVRVTTLCPIPNIPLLIILYSKLKGNLIRL
jgi:hypothetical protein